MHHFLCIEHDNSLVKGEYFVGNPSIEEENKGYTFNQKIPQSSPVNSIGKNVFTVGNTVPIYRRKLNDYLVEDKFAIPLPSDGGTCIDSNSIQFGKSESSICIRPILNLEQQCENGYLSIHRFVSNLYGKCYLVVLS